MAKSPPNELNCSLHVSYGVEALILQALVRFLTDPFALRFCLKFVRVQGAQDVVGTVWNLRAFN
jgi:hypothetical protein